MTIASGRKKIDDSEGGEGPSFKLNESMTMEMVALEENGTWDGTTTIKKGLAGCRWIYVVKLNRKARLVVWIIKRYLSHHQGEIYVHSDFLTF